MKVYLFDVQSGLYEGEDFWEATEVNEAEGVTVLAPPTTRSGQLPVYDRSSGAWKVIPNGSMGKGGDHHD